MTFPIAEPWYHTESLDRRLWRITEPHVHPIFSANIHLVLGSEADLVIDSGMGIAPLRPLVDRLRDDRGKPLICLSTHTHVDHIGAAHEFDIRYVHPLERQELAKPQPYSLNSADIPPSLISIFIEAGYEPLWPWLIDALPYAGYDPARYVLRGSAATKTIEEGDLIDLGDWQAQVLHLPGHSPGQIGLFHAPSGTLFGADAIYDGPLIYSGPGMNLSDYASTLRRLRDLPVHVVHGGHDQAFGKVRLDVIVAQYLALWQMG